MKKHKQTWVKVNVPVDNGIKGIFSTLSRFPNLENVESCEENIKHGPWIYIPFFMPLKKHFVLTPL